MDNLERNNSIESDIRVLRNKLSPNSLRKQAINNLGEITSSNIRVIHILNEMINDEDEGIRQAAKKALSSEANQKIINSLQIEGRRKTTIKYISITIGIIVILAIGWFVMPKALAAIAVPTQTPTIIIPSNTPKPGNPINTWPDGAGYKVPPTHKPSKMLTVFTYSTEWEIRSVVQGHVEAHGQIEYSKSVNLAFAPGAKITNRSRSNSSVAINDYNGDECILIYGLTVQVDSYGEFYPIWIDINLPLPQ
jgi:hypothetical protein